MANTLLTPTIIARESLMQLKNNCVMANNVHRDYKQEFVKVGASVTIRKPVKFTVTDGATRSNQNATETSATFTIDKRKHVSWGFSTQELTTTIEDYSTRYITPAMIVLANRVDTDLAALYKKLWTSGGTPGTTPSTFAALGSMAQKLDDMSVPDDGMRKMVLNPAARWSMADALKGVYDATMAKDMIRKGLLGGIANFEIYGDQNVSRHTTGTRVGTILVDGNSAESAATATTGTIHIDGLTNATDTVTEGDVFTVAAVYAVNPVSKESTGELQQFVVTALATASGNEVDVIVSPALITSGAHQTITALPLDGAAVTFMGSASTAYAQNLAYHKNALGLVMCPLELPDSVTWKSRVQHDGMSIRALKDYDIDNDEEIIRLDVFYGVSALYAELGGRFWG